MFKFLFLHNFRKHFTLTNLLLSVISLTVVGILKYTGFAGHILTIIGCKRF